jgi:hypothetical protein
MIAMDKKLNLLDEVCTTITILCGLGNMVQKGRLKVMNNK